MSRHTVWLDRQPVRPQIAMLDNMYPDAQSLADFSGSRVIITAVTEHDDIRHRVVTRECLKVIGPLALFSTKEDAFLRPPKNNIAKTEIDAFDASARCLQPVRNESEKWRGGTLKEEKSAVLHVTVLT